MLAPGPRDVRRARTPTCIDAIHEPKGLQAPRIPIVVGGNGPEGHVAAGGPLRGRAEPGRAAARRGRARRCRSSAERCEEVGRDPATLRVSVHVWGAADASAGPGAARAAPRVRGAGPRPGDPPGLRRGLAIRASSRRSPATRPPSACWSTTRRSRRDTSSAVRLGETRRSGGGWAGSAAREVRGFGGFGGLGGFGGFGGFGGLGGFGGFGGLGGLPIEPGGAQGARLSDDIGRRRGEGLVEPTHPCPVGAPAPGCPMASDGSSSARSLLAARDHRTGRRSPVTPSPVRSHRTLGRMATWDGRRRPRPDRCPERCPMASDS